MRQNIKMCARILTVPKTVVPFEVNFEQTTFMYSILGKVDTLRPQFLADDERLAGALLDRLTHHVHVIEILAPSFRLNASLRNIKRKTAQNNIDPSAGSSNEV